MASTKAAFGSSGQAITCTITSLAAAAYRQSTAIDNTTNLYLDALVMVTVKTGASGTSATGYVSIYAYGTVDGGATYTDGASGTDGSMSPTSPTNLRLIGVVNAVANATTYDGGPFSVAAAFGGTLPAKWGIVVYNGTGGTLDGTTGSLAYQGVYSTTA